MMVAKRQRKGKVHKNGTKENPWTRVRTSGETKHATFLASPICIGQAQGGGDKTYKKRKPRPFLWGRLPSCLEGVLCFACEIKL